MSCTPKFASSILHVIYLVIDQSSKKVCINKVLHFCYIFVMQMESSERNFVASSLPSASVTGEAVAGVQPGLYSFNNYFID